MASGPCAFHSPAVDSDLNSAVGQQRQNTGAPGRIYGVGVSRKSKISHKFAEFVLLPPKSLRNADSPTSGLSYQEGQLYIRNSVGYIHAAFAQLRRPAAFRLEGPATALHHMQGSGR